MVEPLTCSLKFRVFKVQLVVVQIFRNFTLRTFMKLNLCGILVELIQDVLVLRP